MIAQSIQSLCVLATTDSVSHKTTAWFAVLPLLHLLKGMIKPFDPIQHNPRSIKWVNGIVHLFGHTHAGYGYLSVLLIVTYFFCSFVKGFMELNDLFVVDPLLLPLFYRVCPEPELPELFSISTEHPHLSIVWLAELIKNCSGGYTFFSNVSDYVVINVSMHEPYMYTMYVHLHSTSCMLLQVC